MAVAASDTAYKQGQTVSESQCTVMSLDLSVHSESHTLQISDNYPRYESPGTTTHPTKAHCITAWVVYFFGGVATRNRSPFVIDNAPASGSRHLASCLSLSLHSHVSEFVPCGQRTQLLCIVWLPRKPLQWCFRWRSDYRGRAQVQCAAHPYGRRRVRGGNIRLQPFLRTALLPLHDWMEHHPLHGGVRLQHVHHGGASASPAPCSRDPSACDSYA